MITTRLRKPRGGNDVVRSRLVEMFDGSACPRDVCCRVVPEFPKEVSLSQHAIASTGGDISPRPDPRWTSMSPSIRDKPPRSSKLNKANKFRLHRDDLEIDVRFAARFSRVASSRRPNIPAPGNSPAAEFVTLLPSQIVQGQHESSLAIFHHFHPIGLPWTRFMGRSQPQAAHPPTGLPDSYVRGTAIATAKPPGAGE